MPKPDLFLETVNKICVIENQILFLPEILFTMSSALFVGFLIKHCVEKNVQEF